ncbi:dihydrodipicolinate synthetase family protein 1 [Elsinoe australis]|uniref:Dihydrodipicolinate synthetase family protein 1 n=1 Tax=Elsinoe australis TaxID=40998 RepID=A0A4U7AZX6_9PEZI|nr:dihydrodipicolinate synthetase family protein 1 [Elsinoe australis]
MSSPPPNGIYVPVPTFFARTSASNYDPTNPPLDLETQTAHSLFLVRGGIKGLVILGSTGEAIHITNAERRELISSQRKELDNAGFKDRPIIAGTATQNIGETLEQIKEAKEAGAEYAMVLSPGYFASAASQEGVAKWFEAVADKAVLPVMIYHYPGVTNNLSIVPETFERLAAHKNIVGCKLSHGDIPDHTLIAASPKIDKKSFVVFSGLGQNLLPVLTVGGQGAIDGLAGIFPRTVVRLYQLYHDSSAKGTTKADIEEMRDLQFRICQGERIVAKWGAVGIKEAIARLWGFGDREGARLPLQGGLQGGDAEWAKFKEVHEGLKAYEESLEKGKPLPLR